MAGEDVGEPPSGGDSLEGWLDATAEEMGVSREELLARLRNGDAEASGPGVSALREEFDEKIEDVRERVVQVKRETDGKAPADHDHPDLAPAEVADRADELAAELESLSAAVSELDETVETGFDNYEDVLEYLTDATDDLESKLTTLAEATVDLRDRTRTLAARHAARAAADELAHLANRRGVESAKCGHCAKTVHIGLLAEPKCPHCASTFNDVEPKQGFFGSHTLVVGDPPALEGERADWDVERVMDDGSLDHGEALEDILEDDG